jgi:diaminopimelate epimerase
MQIPFKKYHGAGNDFIIIDNRELHWQPVQGEVSMLCDRHFGIGADGLMLLTLHEGYRFHMTYYNADGNESTMCGNGGRCMAAFARSLGLAGDQMAFSAIDGNHLAETGNPGKNTILVRLKMKDTCIFRQFEDGLLIDTGSPHFVRFVKNVDDVDVFSIGKTLRHDPRFSPGGANIDFAEIQKDGIFVRTYERGVENETLSCGTGATAVALSAAYQSNNKGGSYHIKTRGGPLTVTYSRLDQCFTGIWLEGPATFVFEGEIVI